MEELFIEAVNKAIGQVALDFQGDSNRYWNERDIHWNLFHYLKQQEIFQQKYITELIRAEFPTRAEYEKENSERRARGHYDLVVLEPTSLNTPAVREMTPWTPWGEFLPLVEVLLAVEVKVWWYRWKPIKRRIYWDIKKLTDSQNVVKYPYFLNFVQMDFRRKQMRDYYFELRNHLMEQAKQWPQLKILCVPSEIKIQPSSDNWISAVK